VKNDLVVILHGLESNALVMKGFERSYKRAGFDVYNSTYRCGRRRFKTVAEDVRKEIDHVTRGYNKVHFVCHSLGGLIVRYYIGNRRNKEYYIGKIITMSTPHRGAFWADDVPYGLQIGYTLFGKKMVNSLQDYGMINNLPKLSPYQTLCITTDKNFTLANPLSWIINKYVTEPNDGFVTKRGMTLVGSDTKNFHLDHLYMCLDKELIKYTTKYLLK